MSSVADPPSDTSQAAVARLIEPGLLDNLEAALLSGLVTHLPIWAKDADGKYIFMSPPLLAYWELTASMVLGKTDFDLFPEHAQSLRDSDLHVLESGRQLELAETVIDPRGVARSWLITKMPITTSHPTQTHVAGICFDVTALKRLEKESQQEEAMYRQILDSIPDMVLVKGPQSRVLWANQAFREIYGMTNEQLRGLIDAPFNEPDYTQQYVADDRYVFTTGKTRDIHEEPVTRHDGKVLLLHTVKSAIFDEAGQVTKTVGVSRDITERKRLEMELRQAQKLESVGRLASGIAHEINTPIQFIGDHMTFVQSAVTDLMMLCQSYRAFIAAADPTRFPAQALASLRQAEEDADIEYVAAHLPGACTAIQDGTARVAKLVHAMKRFAHPDTNDRTWADINDGLTSTITISNHELKYVAVVETDFGELPLVSCQISEVNQLFLNLLINASQAIADVVGETGALGRIRVITRQDGDFVLVSISDTGTGIPEAVRGRVFEPFFTTKEVGRGTGQGLAISRLVVEKHGGTITFDTEVGRGTTFHVRLPIASQRVTASRSVVDG